MSAKRILAVQIADLGDLVLTTPALTALRESLPDAHITLLTTPHAARLVEGGGLVDEIITLRRDAGLKQLGTLAGLFKRLRDGKYDTTIFFHHFTTRAGALKFKAIAKASASKKQIGLQNGRAPFLTDSIPDGGFGALHNAEYWLKLVALAGADPTPRLAQVVVNEADREWARERLGEARPLVVIHTGGGSDSYARRWLPERFAETANRLHRERGASIVLVGGKGDNTAEAAAYLQVPYLDLSGETTLPQLSAVLERADLFIGAESGVMHLAAAAGAPLAAIFGPGNAAAWGPWTPESPAVIVRSAPECSPCSYVDHTTGLREGCAARTCITMIDAARVYAVALNLLDGRIPAGLPDYASQRPVARQAVAPISILGLPVSRITYEAWLKLIGEWVQESPRSLHHVCTINPEFIMIAQDDINFANILRRASLTVPDGVGLLWAAKRLNTPLPERVTGSDGVPIIAERAAKEGWKLFLLGAGEGIAQKTAEILQARYPGLQIAGVYSGSPRAEEEANIVERVNASGADILFVAYGAPEQDKWIARNAPRLNTAMAMGVGGSFDFIAGIVPRAPRTMQRLGLEWLYRLIIQPWRIKRMMRLPRFVWAVFRRGAK